MPAVDIDVSVERDVRGYAVRLPKPGGATKRAGIRETAPRLFQTMGNKRLQVLLDQALQDQFSEFDSVFISRKGGELETVRPLSEYPNLYVKYMGLPRDPTSVAWFMSNFGPLEPKANSREGIAVGPILRNLDAMRAAAEALSSGPEVVRDLVRNRSLNTDHMFNLQGGLKFDAVNQQLLLSLRSSSLTQGLWLQFAQASVSGRNIAACQHCGTLFERGAGTSRRLDAKFCSAKHQVEFHSKARSRRNP